MSNPKRIALILVAVLALSSCADKTAHVEEIDGRTCMVVRNSGGRIKAIDCKWTDG